MTNNILKLIEHAEETNVSYWHEVAQNARQELETLTPKNDFIGELKALLTKYNASIGFQVDDNADVWGIFGEQMVLTVNGKEVKAFPFSWSIDKNDL